MAKYRIIKKEITNKAGETDITYEVQKRIIFTWVPVRILSHYNTYEYRALLIYRIWTYKSLESAKRILDLVSSTRIIKYRGHSILKTVDDNLDLVYIDTSDTKYFGIFNEYGYNFNTDLAKLKVDIDRLVKNTKYSVCGTAHSA